MTIKFLKIKILPLAMLLILAVVGILGFPGKAPWRDAADVFVDGEAVPGLPFPEYVSLP